MDETPAQGARRTFASRCVVMGLVFALVALALACGVYLFYSSGKSKPIENPGAQSQVQTFSSILLT